MEKKNDPKRTFRKTTVEMTGEAEVLVINTRFMMRAFEAALACSTLYYYFRENGTTEEQIKKDVSTLSRFLCELLAELGNGVDLHILPTNLDKNCDDEIIL